VATTSLPERPNVEQLRKRSRDLQRRIRAGDERTLRRLGLDAADPAFTLTAAQRLIARHYGFTSWVRLRDHVQTIAERTWALPAASQDAGIVDRFARLACETYDGTAPDPAAAEVILGEHPALAAADLAIAAACADVSAIRTQLANGADVNAPTGPFGWAPLMYAAYSRLDRDADSTLSSVRLLLAAGADPNEGRYFLGYPTPFTVLTGVLGDGEGGQPPHRHAIAFARLLLESGADPNDGQTLYNRMFANNDDFLELLLEYGLGRGDGGPWRRRLPDLTPSPADMVRQLLAWAVMHDQRSRVTLLAQSGVDLVSVLPKGPGPLAGGATPIETALLNGNRAMAALLREFGAIEPRLDAVDNFVAAALAGDAAAVATTPEDVIAAARVARPGLLVWAAARRRPEAVAVLAGAGFDINALGRGDAAIEQPWQTALHTAVESDDPDVVRLLLSLGADPTVRDTRFDGTPLDWAKHLGRPALTALLTAGSNPE
jgi:ankyrin repeat protein